MAPTESPEQRRGIRYDHGIFNPRALQPLPRDVTHSTWLDDFAEAKQRYLDTHCGGIVPTRWSSADKRSNRAAHMEMIEGKYGMTALKPCDHCVDNEATCRVYHGECYEWGTQTENLGLTTTLGWRCLRCRKNGGTAGGCNAQHEA